MTTAERITVWLASMRASGRAAVTARLLIVGAGLAAIVLPASRPWDQLGLIPWLAVPLLVACAAVPDSAAALFFLLVVTGGWLLRAPGDVSWDVAATGIALLVVHLAAAFAAQLPSYAKVERRAVRRWLLPATVSALLGPLAAIGAALVRDAAVPGSMVVTVAALAAATAAVWFAAGEAGVDGSATKPRGRYRWPRPPSIEGSDRARR